MCGRYLISMEDENAEFKEIIREINERYKDSGLKIKSGEIFPTDTVPVITWGPDNQKTANLFKWGFPGFVKSSGVIINARGETLEEKPTFRKLLHTGRCIVPAHGFYEWKTLEGKKIKHIIEIPEHTLFYMAGLYNTFTDKKGSPFTAFVIITTDANSQVTQIHNRMPVIFQKSHAAAWLNSKTKDIGELKALLAPYAHPLEIGAIER